MPIIYSAASSIFRTLRFDFLLLVAMMRAASSVTTRISAAFIATSSSSSTTRPFLHPMVRSRSIVSTATPNNNSPLQHAIGDDRCLSSIANTPLGKEEGASLLLDGLDVYTVPAMGDNHPLSVYGIQSQNPFTVIQHSSSSTSTNQQPSQARRPPILLLHGRTWSSVPVYHLLGGSKHSHRHDRDDKNNNNNNESRSLMEALLASGLQPYAMDFRGFGGTPKDATGCVEPMRCVEDVESVLLWIAQRHGVISNTTNIFHNTLSSSSTFSSSSSSSFTINTRHHDENDISLPDMPTLLGWSQGALVAQLVAQQSPTLLSKLVLYGSIYDPLVRYARAPLYVGTNHKSNTTTNNTTSPPVIMNQFDEAIEDFTVEGTIPPEPARKFAEAALMSDPIKAVWKHLYQFNNCDPARVHVPTLVVAGDQDPYAPLHVQQELFRNLGRGSDRTWSILADADHAVHLLEGRARFTTIVTSFVQNGKRSERIRPF